MNKEHPTIKTYNLGCFGWGPLTCSIDIQLGGFQFFLKPKSPPCSPNTHVNDLRHPSWEWSNTTENVHVQIVNTVSFVSNSLTFLHFPEGYVNYFVIVLVISWRATTVSDIIASFMIQIPNFSGLCCENSTYQLFIVFYFWIMSYTIALCILLCTNV